MELSLCTVAGLFCSPARNIAPHMSLHDLPYHRTVKRCPSQVSLNKVTFLLLLQRSWIRTCSCNCPQHLGSFRTLVERKPKSSRNDVGTPKSTSFSSTFHIGSMSYLFPASFMSSTYTDKNSPFSRLANKQSHFGTFSNRVPKELSRTAFPIKVAPEDDRTDFPQEERLGLPCWTMIFAICASVDGSKYLDILTWIIFNNDGASSS